MTRKEFVIWKNEGQEIGTLYSADEIEKVVDLSQDTYFFIGGEFNRELLDKLNANKPEEAIVYKEDLVDYLQSIGIDAEVDSCRDYEVSRPIIVYEAGSNGFFDLSDFDTFSGVQVLERGSNWTWEFSAEGYTMETSVTVDMDTEQCLDVWTGSNWQTGWTGLHEYIYKAIEIDGDTTEDMYLFRRTSQWEGDQDAGQVMSREELMEYLVSVGRNPEEYL